VSYQVGGCFTGEDHIVNLLRILGVEAGVGQRELSSSYRRVVPNEPVTLARKKKWDRDLGVLLGQLQDSSFEIQAVVGVLPHSIEMFVLFRIEGHLEFEMIASLASELPGELRVVVMVGLTK